MTDDESSLTLDFDFDSNTGLLKARFEPTMPMEFNQSMVEAELQKAGFGDLFLLPTALADFLNKANELQRWEGVLAERRDSEIELNVSSDNLQAFLTLSPAYGGEMPSLEDLRSAIADAGITEGLNIAVLEEIAKSGEADNVIIAEGIPATPGLDAGFEVLFEERKTDTPQVDEKDIADYRATEEFLVVEPGDHLMRRIPATAAVDGKDVFGNPVEADAGVDNPYALNLSGAKISPMDENLLIATHKGHPVPVHCGVRVDNTLVLHNVSLASGNVSFDGSVYVKGDVESNMVVDATGDLVVEGSITQAEVNVGGNIFVKQGVIGEAPKKDEKEINFEAKLNAGGHVTAAFIDYALVEAAGSIQVKDHVTHSHLNSKDRVIVGTAEGSKGHIVGGETKARKGINAHILGSAANTKTKIEVGAEKEIRERYKELSAELKAHEQSLDDLGKALIHIGSLLHKSSGESTENQMRLRQLLQSLHTVVPNISGIVDEKQELQLLVEEGKSSRVAVSSKCHGGVQVRIHERFLETYDDEGMGCFLYNNQGKVEYNKTL